MSLTLRALGPVQHNCLGCGGSCQGVKVRILDNVERERVLRLSAQLGVEHVITDDGWLRQDAGRCALLDDQQRCRLHATFGSASKPKICSQYPLVVINTGDERRVGIDPGCYTARQTARTGDLLDPSDAAVHHTTLPADRVPQEAAIIGLLRPSATVSDVLSVLTPGQPRGQYPAAVVARFFARLQAADLPTILARPEGGPAMRAGLTPLANRLSELSEPPVLALSPGRDAWTVECARRLVFLRLQVDLPIPVVAGLVLLGGIALNWVDGPDAAFDAGLAAWCRALRAPMFLQRVLVDPPTMNRLFTGS